ncbi:PilZ domain-containing protein [Pseudomonas sp. DTU_2021_1001937_2_SI_NGA_ILE_001]|uniref:PilZ domain-containing protein n=1 Tax=Pseudomonas sp. DTU_2021_1001937_2_SI_NGA_ILE_001 TaxID=3077589 RepID=UPI0025F6C39B|nr:PilZ domain-containing protein [Pseudomonas sp. DTU_2021_1001937_2_SI_NGA_ILE_001]WNW10854.1 PilZ domain-containing protein [Pseudomonas sp. DTU_2021_1001937_2_SI_NGA_ILE_001]
MSRIDQGYAEKRDFIRMRVDADISIIHAGQVIPAVCLDLSSTGMQVQAPRAFAIGDRLSIRIDSDHPALKGLEAETEVVWLADQDGGGQKLGLSIISMS